MIFASRAGLRYELQPTIWPRRIVDVSWLIAAIVVQHSNTASCAGRGTLWKWS